MARLRLFAGLRQAAGTGEVELNGGSVGEILSEAAAAYGPDFERGLLHIVSRHRCLAAGRREEAGENPHGRGFSGAVGAEEA